MTYARARLLVGIFGVGTWVLIAFFALLLGVPGALATTYQDSDFALLALGLLTLYVLVSAPFDLLGGYILPHHFGRKAPPFRRWVAQWARGVVAHSVILLLIGFGLVCSAHEAGVLGFIVFAAVSKFLLFFLQPFVARLLSSATKLSAPKQLYKHIRLRFARSFDPSFTGAIIGPPGAEVVVVPDSWRRKLTTPVRKIALARRVELIRSNSRLDGLVFAFSFNLIGVAICALFAGADLDSSAGLLGFIALYTLWSFLGLLLLPSFSRSGVFFADKAVAKRDKQALKEYIRCVDRLLDDEPARKPIIEAIFHPIPSVARRFEQMQRPIRPMPAPWNTARTAVYLSWAGLSPLSRAVHCNVGKPELWVYLPID